MENTPFEDKSRQLNDSEKQSLKHEAFESRMALIEWANKVVHLAFEHDEIEIRKQHPDYFYAELVPSESNEANDAYSKHHSLRIRLDSIGNTETPKETIYINLPVSEEFWNKYFENGFKRNDDKENLAIYLPENPDAIIVQRITCISSEEVSDIRRISPNGSIDYKLIGGENEEEAMEEFKMFLEEIEINEAYLPEVIDGDPDLPMWPHQPSEESESAYINKLRYDLTNFRLVPQIYNTKE